MFSSRPVVLKSTRKVQPSYKGIRTKQELNHFPSNFIKTSRQQFLKLLTYIPRYNAIDYLPLSLLIQFKRYANIYFLVIAIISSIDVLSSLNPFSAIAPLVFVLGLSMAREGYEDFQRHRSDSEVNATPAMCIRDSKIHNYTWADVEIGDLIYVEENDSFPADLIVLGTCFENGVCYIETSSLDGEKNLKPKSALMETQRYFTSIETIKEENLEFQAKEPTSNIHEFEGSVKFGQQRLVMNAKQLVLRGAFLRNTKWIIGIAVYTGQDTKIMLNAEPGRFKLLLVIMFIQILLCLICALFSSYWLTNYGKKHWYLGYDDDFSATLQSFYVYFSYFLLFNTMIPISLIVSLEFVKVFQSYFMMQDEEMYVKARDKYCKVQTTTINEELGQVEYIFSDKTGTLTCNQMEFKYCLIGDILYGKEDDATQQEIQTGSNQENPSKLKQQNNIASIHPQDKKDVIDSKEVQIKQEKQEVFKHSVFNFKDTTLNSIIKDANSKEGQQQRNITLKSQDQKASIELKTQKDLVDYYFFLFASAHECIVQKDKQGNNIFQGPSPDEITLVDAAANLGYIFMGSASSEQTFELKGQEKRIELLKSFEFDSKRKRMSVIIRDNGVIKLLIKGADNVIKARLSAEQPYLPYIEKNLEDFSRIGFRCLLMATRILSENEYKEFDEKFQKLADSENKDKELNALADEIETNLFLIGASAVEDKLQDKVPETIADFLKANIKVWMLTGDKLETAENIAKSCRLIQGDMTIMRLQDKELQSVSEKLQEIQEQYDECIRINRKKSIIVDGEPLAVLQQHEGLKIKFVKMAENCESVVCCRVTPNQKADVVELIKTRLNKITLAIGDGANDVNMIQKAHIGVGLYGNEGMRAVQSSDFAFGEFRCLWRLLFVHGHWSYIRISEMILYFFYKNMIFTVPQFFFAFFSAYSSQTFFDDWYITFYNMVFTALPLIIRATFDQDVNYRIHPIFSTDQKMRQLQDKQESYLKSKFPYIYYVGQQKTIFTIPNYVFWVTQGAVQGFIVFMCGYWSFNQESLSEDAFPSGLASFSLTLFTAIVFIADMKICFYTKFWTWINFISVILLSLGVYFLYVVISHYWVGTNTEYTPLTLMQTSHFYLVSLFLTALIFLFDLLQGQIIREFFKSKVDDMRMFIQHFGDKLKSIKQGPQVIQQEFGGSFWEEIQRNEQKVELIQPNSPNQQNQ